MTPFRGDRTFTVHKSIYLSIQTLQNSYDVLADPTPDARIQ